MTVANIYRNTDENFQCTIPMMVGEPREQLFQTGICFGFDPQFYPVGQRIIGKLEQLKKVLADLLADGVEPYTDIEIVPSKKSSEYGR